MDRKLNIGILGSRGIPNSYGGFEECAENLAERLVNKGHEVSVYTVKEHQLKDNSWRGIQRILINNPEKRLGTFGQFIYDLNSNIDSRKRHFDIVLHLGYTSDSVWYWIWPDSCTHIVNMDGMEWQRSKYNRQVQRFLKWAEKLATKRARCLVADSVPIEQYLLDAYDKPVRHIAYGANIPEAYSRKVLSTFGLKERAYDLVVARIIPDNHIEMMLQAKELSWDKTPLLILCNENKMKEQLAKKYAHLKHINFYGPVYEKSTVSSLRHFCRYYLHGHSAGGTNPSLLEAMACSSAVAAHKNKFNQAVLGNDANYFSSPDELKEIFEHYNASRMEVYIYNNLEKIRMKYNWDLVTDAYEKLFYDALLSA